MKKSWRYFAMLFFFKVINQSASIAQINLQFTLDSTFAGDLFYCTDIGNNDFKYVFLNQYTNSFSLYNMDMSQFISNIHIPSNDSIAQGFSVMYISKTLFDCDSTNIEYAYENQFNLNHSFRVFRTDGTLLLEVDSANGPYGFGVYGGSIDWRPIKNTSDGTKLFLQKHDANDVGEILVYALCGSLHEGIKQAQIFFYDNKGVILKIVDINEKGAGQLNVYASDLSSGTYTYSLIADGKVIETKKW